MVRIWMLITFAIIVIWIALSWGQLTAFFNQAKPAMSPVGHFSDMPRLADDVR